MSAVDLPPPFPGFSQAGLDVLRDLADNNDRDWFNARKSVYLDHLKGPLDLLVADVARRLAERGIPYTAGRPFRIYRDVRFSKDKRPYQTHVSAQFTRPDSDDPALIYVHVAPGASFVAMGVYRPSVAYLRPVRRRIVDRWNDVVAMRDALGDAGLTLGPAGDPLTGMPQGFAAERDHEGAELVRWQSLVAQRALDDADIREPQLSDRVVQAAAHARPLFDFLDAAHA